MPTFTTIALENLLEHHQKPTKIQNSTTLLNISKNPSKPTNSFSQNDDSTKKLNHVFISPALYTTPEPTVVLSSGSVSPSPYVFNRKGRGGGNGSGRSCVDRRVDGFEVESGGGESGEMETGGGESEKFEMEVDDVEEDEFVGCDALSVVSCSSEVNGDHGRVMFGFESSSHVGEFYDAIEDFNSDGGSMMSVVSCNRNIESELQTTRLHLLEEIEKRKTVEEDLATMSTHWQRVGQLLLSETGQTILAPSNDSSHMKVDFDVIKQFSEEVIVARFVSEAMGKAEAQDEAELAAEIVIGSKDKEISRLKDRLQYYEAMIHEMSQKNLESMEVARRQRDRKRGHRKWLWSCIGTSIVIGASIIAYSYAPQPSFENVGDTQPDAGHN